MQLIDVFIKNQFQKKYREICLKLFNKSQNITFRKELDSNYLIKFATANESLNKS